jgi:hypothetical protein
MDEPSSPTPRFRFRLRHVLLLVTVVCLFLGVPMLGYTFGTLLSAIAIATGLLLPLIALQLIFILIVPGLRRRLLRIPTDDQNTDKL